MKNRLKGRGFREPRRDRIHQGEIGDVYQKRTKPSEPTVCPRCGALFHKGRWTWGSRPAQAHEEFCPACRRIEDRSPAGFLHLSGAFIDARKEEILNVARNEEREEKTEHPLSRIIDIQAQKDGIVITTTDTHLPRRIGAALKRAYHGELDFQYAADQNLIRATWRRSLEKP